MMLAGFLAFVILITRLFPETPLGRSFHQAFVEVPLRLAERIERKHLILVAILLIGGQSLAMIGSAEIALAYAIDLSVYFDAVLATSAAAIVLKVKSGWAACKARMAGLRRARPRSVRTRAKTPERRTASNDDDHRSVPLLRAA